MKARLGLPLLAALAALLLPLPARSQDEPRPPADLLSHVKVGQVWVFSVPAAGAMRLDRKVTEVLPDEGRVVYTETSTVPGAGEPEVTAGLAWTWNPGPALPVPEEPIPGYSTGRETFTFGELRLETAFFRIQADGDDTQHWVAVKGERETFPGIVRQRSGGETLIELLRVEGP